MRISRLISVIVIYIGCFLHVYPMYGAIIENNQNVSSQQVVYLVRNNDILTQRLFKDSSGKPLENTRFVIQYNYSLSEDINIPDDCVLVFEGGSISGKHSITGNYTAIIAPLNKVFGDNVLLKGKWNVVELYPEWFGAVSDLNFDSTLPISNCIKTAYRIKSAVKFKRGTYKVCGNNPCGLEIVKNEEPDVIYSEDRNLNVDFSNSHIYYYPSSENDCFAFVGYLRHSVWENLILHVAQTNVSHVWGDVFSTAFHIPTALHRFSCNIFRNMSINALPIKGKQTTFRRVLNIDCLNNEAQHHDDLSVFEKIDGGGFTRFYYTTNSNSVSLSFNDCSLNLNRDNSVLFDVNTTEWAGYNRFNNCHFTIIDCNKALLVRLKSINQPYGVVYFNESRVEIRNTSKNWMYFDIENGKVFFNDFYSVNYAGVSSSHSFGRIKYGSVIFSESLGVYTPITLVGVPQGYDNQNESLIFEHSQFIKDETHVVPYPRVIYESSGGKEFSNRYDALNSANAFGNVVVKECSSNTPDVRDRWLDSYVLNNSRIPVIDETVNKVRLSNKRINKYLATSTTADFNIPFDVVISNITYCQYGYDLKNQGVSKVALFVYRDDKLLKKIIVSQTPKEGESLKLINDTLYLRAGDQLRCALLKGNNSEMTDNYSNMSFLEIEYKVANWIGDLKIVYSPN